MSNQILSINGFENGIINDETAQVTNGFVDMSGIDIWTEDGIAQINFRLEQDTSTSMSDDVLSFTSFDGTTIAGLSGKEKWQNASGTTWTTMSTTTTTGDNHDITTYQNYLIYASRTIIGRSTNTTIAGGFTDNPTWGTGTFTFANGGATDLHFFKEFQNRLYISDGNILTELDGASAPTVPANWVVTQSKFVLPVNESIRSLEIIGNSLAIGTLAGNFYLWDGSSANASQIIKTSLGGIHAMIEIENTLFVFAGIDGTVYRYNGADFIPVIQIPNFNILSNSLVRKPAVRRFKNGMIFCIPRNGIYVYNRVDEKSPFRLNKYGPLSDGGEIKETQGDVNALYVINITTTNDQFVIGYRNSKVSGDFIDRTSSTKRYRIEENGSDDTSVSPYMDSVVYELRNKKGQPLKVQGVQGLFKTQTNQLDRLQVEYRLDNTIAYTVLGTIGITGVTDLTKILRGINRRVDKVQFRFRIGGNNASVAENTKITMIKIF